MGKGRMEWAEGICMVGLDLSLHLSLFKLGITDEF